ncbi:M48 family metalloprotease [Ekhidna sp.]
MKNRVPHILILTLAFVCLTSCKKTDNLIDFTEEDEILLGEKLSQAFAENPNFNVIPTQGNSVPYGYASSRLNEITTSTLITKGEEFTWNIYLLDDTERQAFAFPGGHIYISTGMIFFLDNEDQFSGLVAHLAALINQSLITENLFFKYGVNNLKQIANSGGDDVLESIINDLELRDEFLTFTRGNEIQADTLAISILSETSQSCRSGGLFFEKILNVQSNQQSKFIAAHQLEQSRIENIDEVVAMLGCDASIDDESASRYQSFRNSLP